MSLLCGAILYGFVCEFVQATRMTNRDHFKYEYINPNKITMQKSDLHDEWR